MANSIKELNSKVIECRTCERLVNHREEVAQKKVRRYQDWEYWGRPVPGFGDPNARVLLIGLAPAAHGANRTGRMFTGDKSGDWLYQALYDYGFANQPESEHGNDGLELKDAFITALLRCVPPQNKPLKEEISNCRPFLEEELRLLNQVKVVITLGRLAFENYCRMKGLKGLSFGHAKIHNLDSGPDIICSYHPSRQNTQTGRLKWEAWQNVFSEARRLINS